MCNALGDFYADTGGPTSWSFYGDNIGHAQTATVGWRAADEGTQVPISYCTFFGVVCVNNVITEMCVPPACSAGMVSQRRRAHRRCELPVLSRASVAGVLALAC